MSLKIKSITTKIIMASDLPQTIFEEIAPENPTLLFWTKVPKTIKEVRDFPEWHELCKSEDLVPGERILIQVKEK